MNRFRLLVVVIFLLGLSTSLPVSGQTASQVTVQRVIAPGFFRPVEITHAGDGSRRLFVVEQAGKIRIIKNGSVLATPFLDLTGQVSTGGEQGLLGLAFHPQYKTNGQFFIYYTDKVNVGNTVVARYTVSANPDVADAASREEILYVVQPYANHNGGHIAFGPDGYLYIGLGDGGSGGDPLNNAQNLSNLLGKILRIDVDSGSPYAIPSTNPFFNQIGKKGEIWAYGLRNPWKWSFDRANGDLYIGDVGQNLYEEVDFQPGGSTGGLNYGWRCMEGFHTYNTNPPCTGTLTPPIAEYGRDLGASITGGYVYRGKLFPDLAGLYFYADYATGKLWSLRKTAENPPAFTTPRLEINGVGFYVSAFGEDEDGEVYIADYSGGRILRLESTAGPVTVVRGNIAPSSTTANRNELVTYTIHLYNDGAAPAALTLTNPIPSGLAIQGSPSASAGTVALVVNTVTWNGTVPAGGFVTITYSVRVDSNRPFGSIVSYAQVSDADAELLNLSTALWVPKAKLATTATNFSLPGTQPGTLVTALRPSADCDICHSAPVYDRWRGSAMGQAGRDPLMWAAMAVSNAFAPNSGEYCLRCHTGNGWLQGRSTPSDGSALTAVDIDNGVSCQTCHRMVDQTASFSDDAVAIDAAIRQNLVNSNQLPPPGAIGSAMIILDPQDNRRGPFNLGGGFSYHTAFRTDLLSQTGDPLTRARVCGVCHNLSNPLLSFNAVENEYWPNPDGQPAPSFIPDSANGMFPLERTFDEWRLSQYATAQGVVAPQFAGMKADGIVQACQDCHMTRITGAAVDPGFNPVTRDCQAAGCLPQHDLLGANTWLPSLLQSTEWRLNAQGQAGYLNVTRSQTQAFLQKAATMTIQMDDVSGNKRRVAVTVYNQTGHKLPTGYPEGRRMWINLRAYDAAGNLIYESGVYDPASGVLTVNAEVKVYEAKLGLSPDLAAYLGLNAGETFFFSLNNTWLKDNRIPPRGYTVAAYDKGGLRPVGAIYVDGQYYDLTEYSVPSNTERVTARLYYQTASKEYLDFLRDFGGVDGLSLDNLRSTIPADPVLVTAAWTHNFPNFLPVVGR